MDVVLIQFGHGPKDIALVDKLKMTMDSSTNVKSKQGKIITLWIYLTNLHRVIGLQGCNIEQATCL